MCVGRKTRITSKGGCGKKTPRPRHGGEGSLFNQPLTFSQPSLIFSQPLRGFACTFGIVLTSTIAFGCSRYFVLDENLLWYYEMSWKGKIPIRQGLTVIASSPSPSLAPEQANFGGFRSKTRFAHRINLTWGDNRYITAVLYSCYVLYSASVLHRCYFETTVGDRCMHSSCAASPAWLRTVRRSKPIGSMHSKLYCRFVLIASAYPTARSPSNRLSDLITCLGWKRHSRRGLAR